VGQPPNSAQAVPHLSQIQDTPEACAAANGLQAGVSFARGEGQATHALGVGAIREAREDALQQNGSAPSLGKVCCAQECASQVCPAEISPSQCGSVEIGSSQIALAEVGSVEVGFVEVSSAQVEPAKGGPAQVGSAQVGLDLWVPGPPRIPGS
jgi:hypothetical protein